MSVYYDPNTVMDSVAYGLVGNQVLSWMKGSRFFPFLNDTNTARANRVMAIALAGLAALGIEHQYAYADGVLTLTLSGLTIWSVLAHLKVWLVSYGCQQMPYHVMKRTESSAMASTVTSKGTTTTTVVAESGRT